MNIELPKYQCHKEVWALKILWVTLEENLTGIIKPEDERYSQFKVSEQYMKKHIPKEGGYYVLYEGGYESYSPAKEFEEGYILIE